MGFSAETGKSTKNPAFRLSDKMVDKTLKELGRSVDAPLFILPWLDRFYEPDEIRILEAFQTTSMDGQTVQKKFDLGHDQRVRLFKRGVLTKNQQGDIIPADFHARYDIWALFEGFKDVPDKIRTQLNRWELDHYIASHESGSGAVEGNRPAGPGCGHPPVFASGRDLCRFGSGGTCLFVAL